MIERGSRVPSGIPSRFDRLPAATLRTTTSSGMISTSRISCSRMFRRRTKWVGMPISASRIIRYSLMRLFSTPLPVITPFFWALNGGRVVLEVLDESAGLRPLEQDFCLPLVELAAAGHHDPLLGGTPSGQAGRGGPPDIAAHGRGRHAGGAQGTAWKGASCGGPAANSQIGGPLAGRPAVTNRRCRSRREARH